jgi:tol-pal system protein YbgF
MSAHRLSLPVAILALSLTACAVPGGGNSISGRAALSPEERRLQDAENKVAALQRRLDALDAVSTGASNVASKDDLRDLLGQIERLSNELRQMDRRSRQFYVDLDQRLRALEGDSAPASGAGFGVLAPTPPLRAGGLPGEPGGQTPGATAPGAPELLPAPGGSAASDPDEERSYLATFELLKNGKYDDAVQGFETYLQRYPSGRYADNAAYWMAEANFVKRDYTAAARAFQRVVSRHPDSPRAPDALFKLALTQVELNQTRDSEATLREVIERYPNSNAARLAQQRLSGGN